MLLLPIISLRLFGQQLVCIPVRWLVVWGLGHINPWRLFNAKFISMKIVLFQTISTQFKCKYSLIAKNISISSYLA